MGIRVITLLSSSKYGKPMQVLSICPVLGAMLPFIYVWSRTKEQFNVDTLDVCGQPAVQTSAISQADKCKLNYPITWIWKFPQYQSVNLEESKTKHALYFV